MKTEVTISVGIEAMLSKAEHFRKEADRFERLAAAMREVERALAPNGKAAPKAGRPANERDRKVVLDAIATMPERFGLKHLKEVTNGHIKVDAFRRLFREVRDDGTIREITKARGQRDGIYEKRAATSE
jgi:hypothetical protein